jgi:HPt (histidine-containing phosphotransfer) domain-containing protein
LGLRASRFEQAAIADIWGSSTDRAYRAVLGVFAAEAAQLGETIEAAMLVCDMTAVHYAAHTLKGAAANVGAVRLSAIAAGVAQWAEDGRATPACLPPLRRELRAVLGEIGRGGPAWS